MKSVSPKPHVSQKPRQVPTSPWPKGLSTPIAVLALEPAELCPRYGIVFDEAHDGLDYTQWAILQLPSAARVALVRHRDCPSPGTEVWTDDASTDPASTLDELLRELALTRDGLTWVQPDIAVLTSSS